MKEKQPHFFSLFLATIGIVYGDIGTSPLYAFKQSLINTSIDSLNVFGILSLIFWSLIIVVSIKYLLFVLNADNNGEGGGLALLALFKKGDMKAYNLFFVLAIVGTGLLLGDGMLTPAISVMSAVEGLNVIWPNYAHLTWPLTFIILLALFFFQYLGTAKIGSYFGPIIMLWFFVIGILGLIQVIQYPEVIAALSPYYAYQFFMINGIKGYFILGSVFLVVTGGEALYADLGQFGKSPIRYSWFTIVLPCLLLNYFGQGAYVLQHPEGIINPFYLIAPAWFATPLIILATLATIIASQAVISASFSLTKQAVLLDLCPRVEIIQTSKHKAGQIYVPSINIILGIGTLFLVLVFKTSDKLVHAYGLAVNLQMTLVTFLTLYMAYKVWKWSILKIACIFSVFLIVDLAFVGANLPKVITGGWIPIVFAIGVAAVMYTWAKGVDFMRATLHSQKSELQESLKLLKAQEVNYLPGTVAVFITDQFDSSGKAIFQYLKLNHMLPENILFINMETENSPYTKKSKRYKLSKIDDHMHCLIMQTGFMELINIPRALKEATDLNILPFKIDPDKTLFLASISNVFATKTKANLPFFWQEKLFAFMVHNSTLDITFFHLPHDKTIAIGRYFEI